MNVRLGGAAVVIAALLIVAGAGGVNAAGLELVSTAPDHRSGYVTVY
jgi:hypothetical protein